MDLEICHILSTSLSGNSSKINERLSTFDFLKDQQDEHVVVNDDQHITTLSN